jgi:hypothetical protein
LGADVVYQKGKGKGDAIRTAVEHIDADVDYVVFTDADYTYPAGYIPLMIEVLEGKPHVGMVAGNRFNDRLDIRALHNLLYIGNRILAFTHSIFNGVRMRDPLTGMRVVRAEILRDWKRRSTGFDIEVELNHRIKRKGYNIAEISVMYRARLGRKNLKMRHRATILRRVLIETLC